ncbi:DUF423 domain-containing protein [Lysobacter sp. GX 14042]|uniref:DUF423 domain-containing protein n=1 Tax=Lysobacter sp. GX 14042 TaxID=2907155 RepID=UPI001F1EB618|nr:DUF423 domain-containing protein [Lysobacter sp. GX 14042]MCE7032523.1 DUF423 domain-containing protein [Lysobacter sp. GX 14042]
MEGRAGAGAGRGLAAAGAVMAALSVALAAYASHAGAPEAREALRSAALFLFGHGIALAALAPRAARRPGRWALLGLLLGTVLFSGSVAGARLLGWSSAAAPLGGILMIVSWLAWAVDAARR